MSSPRVVCEGVAPTGVAELAWLLDLLVQTARYAEPALSELDRSLLPGVAARRPSIQERFASLWSDSVAGCPELLIVAGQVDDAGSLSAKLSTLPKHGAPRHELLSEPATDRRAVRRRIRLLDSDVRLRRAYRNILDEVWRLAGPEWRRRGRAVAMKASTEWGRRIAAVRTAADVVRLMPPRHPLTNTELAAALFQRRRRFVVVPIYFCMSGGQVADLDEVLHIGVPASALEPIRRVRDASFVADRMRILAEPTRVHILIHLISAPAGVMEITRALGMSQPTVSEHVRVLTATGLLRAQRKGGRTVYVPSLRRVERVLEDARATLARWEVR